MDDISILSLSPSLPNAVFSRISILKGRVFLFDRTQQYRAKFSNTKPNKKYVTFAKVSTKFYESKRTKFL